MVSLTEVVTTWYPCEENWAEWISPFGRLLRTVGRVGEFFAVPRPQQFSEPLRGYLSLRVEADYTRGREDVKRGFFIVLC